MSFDVVRTDGTLLNQGHVFKHGEHWFTRPKRLVRESDWSGVMGFQTLQTTSVDRRCVEGVLLLMASTRHKVPWAMDESSFEALGRVVSSFHVLSALEFDDLKKADVQEDLSKLLMLTARSSKFVPPDEVERLLLSMVPVKQSVQCAALAAMVAQTYPELRPLSQGQRAWLAWGFHRDRVFRERDSLSRRNVGFMVYALLCNLCVDVGDVRRSPEWLGLARLVRLYLRPRKIMLGDLLWRRRFEHDLRRVSFQFQTLFGWLCILEEGTGAPENGQDRPIPGQWRSFIDGSGSEDALTNPRAKTRRLRSRLV